MFKHISFFILCFLFCTESSPAGAQPIRNLSFDTPGIVNPDQPIGWQTRWIGYQLSLDSTIVRSGKYSLKSKRLPRHDSGFSMGRQNISAEILKGKQLRVKAWMRSEEIQHGSAIVRLSVFDKDHNPLKSVQFPKDEVTQTSDWNSYETEVFISTKAELITIDAFHSGNGTVWFDEFTIEINGKSYNPDSHEPWQATAGEIHWLKKNAIPLHTDIPGTDFSDLTKLKPLFKDAEIVGLGEGTHGTREFFRMKHRLVEWFAQQQDTLIFAIEASMPEARAVNRYVLTGEGNPKRALANLHFWVWNIEEVLDLIEWMYNYNRLGNGHIEFWGFDMQYPEIAADSVRSFITKADPTYLNELEKLYEPLTGPEELRGMQPKQLTELYHSMQLVTTHIEKNRSYYLKTFEQAVVDWAIHYARIVEQAVSRFIPNGVSRDESMAKNINWIYERRKSGTPVLVWAHNSHVARSPSRFGKLLADQYGDAYKNIGFAFGEGTYRAVRGPNEPTEVFPAPPPPEGSVEYVLQKVDLPVFALDLQKARRHSQGNWLHEPKPFRNIGSIARDEPYHNIPVAEYFDVLIYHDQTTASHPLEQPKN